MIWSIIAVYLCLINLLTYWLWGHDKSCAVLKLRRVPESRLLGLCALGGWPAAMVGTHVFRHKSSKQAFIAKLYILVVVQTVCLCFVIIKM